MDGGNVRGSLGDALEMGSNAKGSCRLGLVGTDENGILEVLGQVMFRRTFDVADAWVIVRRKLLLFCVFLSFWVSARQHPNTRQDGTSRK